MGGVPRAVLAGLGQSGTEFAFLFGTTRPFDSATLARLYPGGRSDFLARFERAADEAVGRGFLCSRRICPRSGRSPHTRPCEPP